MEINKDNYKEWLIRYFENDLTFIEKTEAEQFIKENEWAAQEWDLIRRTRLKPNMEIRFPNKKLLFRTEEPVVELKRPVTVFKLYRYAALAAAAALLAFAIIFSIRKPGKRTETAHSNVRNNIIPTLKHAVNPQAQVAPQPEKMIIPHHVLPNTPIEKRSSEKKDFMASEKPFVKENSQRPVQEKNVPTPDMHPMKDNYYATNKFPVNKQTDSLPVKQAIEEVREPNNPVAVAKKSPQSIPVKLASNNYGNDKSLFQSILDLLHKVSIKKEVVNNQTYYALSIETPDIKINKTIK